VKFEFDQLFQCTDAHPHTTHVEALPCRRTLLCAQPRISASVIQGRNFLFFWQTFFSSTLRSRMDSGFLPIDDRYNELVWLRLCRAVFSVSRLQRHRGHGEVCFGCGDRPALCNYWRTTSRRPQILGEWFS